MLEYFSQFTINDMVAIHCAIMLITISIIMSVSLIVFVAMHAIDTLLSIWYSVKLRRNKLASMSRINGIYTVSK